MEIRSLGRYQVRDELGRGSMGVVYRGYDPVLDREIALKAVDVPLALDPERRQRFLERFFLEAKIAAKLIHPNIVVTHDAATDDSTAIPFIAMELVSGESLHQRLQRSRIEWREALALIEPLAQALDYAHQASVVHRDIKPANVLLTPKGVPKIADFGIAKLPDIHLTQSGKVMGTPYFMSPEQLEGDDVDGRSDVFSLGALFYNLLTGEPPFRGSDLASISQQVLYKSPPPPSELVDGIPAEVDAVVARAMAKNRDERYQSGAELAEELARVSRGESPQKPLSFGERTIASAPKPREPGSPPAPAPEAEAEPEPEPPLSPAPSSSAGCFVLLVLLGALAAGAALRWDAVRGVLELFREQQREEIRRDDVKTEAASILARAETLLEKRDYDRARSAIERALSLSRDARDGEGEATALLWRGRLEADQGAWSKARADLDASASVFTIYGLPEGRAAAIVELANLERDLGRFDVAATLYDDAERFVDTTSCRAMLALMRGDLESAERGFRRSDELVYAGAVAFARGDTALAETLWASHSNATEVQRWRGLARASANSEESVLQTLFRAEPRTARSEERRKRLP